MSEKRVLLLLILHLNDVRQIYSLGIMFETINTATNIHHSFCPQSQPGLENLSSSSPAVLSVPPWQIKNNCFINGIAQFRRNAHITSSLAHR